MARKLKTISIHGRQYVTVSERLLGFNEMCPNGSITTELSFPNDEVVRAKATVVPDVANPTRVFTGYAEEVRASSNINRTSACQNCETSAIGRALGMMGIGILEGVASADEVVSAKAKKFVLANDGDSIRKTCNICNMEYNPKPGTESWSKNCYPCFEAGKVTKKKVAEEAPWPVSDNGSAPF